MEKYIVTCQNKSIVCESYTEAVTLKSLTMDYAGIPAEDIKIDFTTENFEDFLNSLQVVSAN